MHHSRTHLSVVLHAHIAVRTLMLHLGVGRDRSQRKAGNGNQDQPFHDRVSK
jgi:hypothetical protein